MAVYGGMLSFFSEQARRFPLYTMNPLPKGGYSKRIAVGYITAIFQYVKKGNLTRENDTEADVNVPVIWSRVKLDISKNLLMMTLYSVLKAEITGILKADFIHIFLRSLLVTVIHKFRMKM